MKSNIKYFTRNAMYMVLFGLIYGVFVGLLSNHTDAGHIISWLIVGAVVMNLGSQVSLLKSTVPLILGFGATRKRIFSGIVWYDFVNMTVPAVVISIVATIFDAGMSPVLLAMVVFLLDMAAQALGMIMGISIYKLKGVAAFLMIILVSVVIGGVGAMGVIVYAAEMSELMVKGITSEGPFVMAAVIAVIWAIVLMVNRRMICKYSL